MVETVTTLHPTTPRGTTSDFPVRVGGIRHDIAPRSWVTTHTFTDDVAT